MEAKIYNQKGKEAGTISLPEKVFGAKWRSDLVHQVVEGMRSNGRAGTAHARTRGEVSGGGKKPWKQKGTGRARHGSTRSPIWVGGGVAHGPLKDKNYKRKISKNMRTEALYSVLSKKWKDGEIIFVDTLTVPEIKTQKALEILKGLLADKKLKEKNVLMAFYENDEKTKKSFRNIKEAQVSLLKNLNPLEALNYRYILIDQPEESVKFLESRAS